MSKNIKIGTQTLQNKSWIKVKDADLINTYDYFYDTSDATATADDILSSKTAYVNGEKITGTIDIGSESLPLNMASGDMVITAGGMIDYYNEVIVRKPSTLIPSNIRNNVNIGGVIGSYVGGNAQLNPATISLNGTILSITDGDNGTFSEFFDIYSDGFFKVSVSQNTTTYDLRVLQLPTGYHTIYVKVRGSNMDDSLVSNYITYNSSTTGYPITYTLTNMVTDASSPVYIPYGESVTVTLQANSGYLVPESASSISVSNARITSYTAFNDAVPAACVFTLENATGGVTITASGVSPSSYSITVNVSNGTSFGDSTISSGSTARVSIIPNTGYSYPSSITVIGASYVYNQPTGVIVLNNPTGNVTIACSCVGGSYNIISILSHVESDPTNPTTIPSGGSVGLQYNADVGYLLPTSSSGITVTGGTLTSYFYDNSAIPAYCMLGITAPTSDVTITINATFGGGYTLTVTGERLTSTYGNNMITCLKVNANNIDPQPSYSDIDAMVDIDGTLIDKDGNVQESIVIPNVAVVAVRAFPTVGGITGNPLILLRPDSGEELYYSENTTQIFSLDGDESVEIYGIEDVPPI